MVYYKDKAEEQVLNELKGVSYLIKSKNYTKKQIELTLKVKIKRNNTEFVKKINEIQDVESVSLINFEENYL